MITHSVFEASDPPTGVLHHIDLAKWRIKRVITCRPLDLDFDYLCLMRSEEAARMLRRNQNKIRVGEHPLRRAPRGYIQ